jgi:hypothetical protein
MQFSAGFLRVSVCVAAFAGCATACSSERNGSGNQAGASNSAGNSAMGGSSATGGATNSGGATVGNGGATAGATSNGGASSGGASSGGATSGGAANSGGSSNGGSGNGGTNSAGQNTGAGQGGSNNGGSNGAMGGSSAGGASNGGASNAGASNAGASNAGASNGGTSNAGSGGGSSSGCTKSSDVLFCEDFESVSAGTVSKANGYTPMTSMGTLTIDGTHARGKQALHVHTEQNGHAYIQVSPFAPPQNSFFGRMHVWVTAFPSAPNYAHFTLVEASGSPAGLIRPIGGQFISGKGDLWGPGTDGGPTNDWTNWKESAPAEAGKWLCIEWEMTNANSAINIWIDGAAKTDLSVNASMHGGGGGTFEFPTFNNIWFGWWLYQNGPTPSQYDLWIDDISLGTKRQGC